MAKTYVAPQNLQALTEGGLTTFQASLYETLVQHGSLNARRASFIAGVPRTLGYKILSELKSLGLVIKKDEPSKVAEFVAAHPLKLKEMAETRFEEAQKAKSAFDGAIGKLVSDFNKVSGQPGVRILEGIKGYKELLEDQIAERKPITILRSPKYVDFKEAFNLSEEHYANTLSLDIPVKIITSLSIPTEVAIYGDKVAITMYQKPLITMIIENMPISMTFLAISEAI